MTITSHGLTALPDWSAVPSNSEDDRLLVNHRLAYFGRLFFILSFSFYVYGAAMISILQKIWPPLTSTPMLWHAAATLVFAFQWLACRRGRRSSKQLNSIDVGGTLLGIMLFGGLTLVEADGFQDSVAVSNGHAESLLIAMITLAMVTTRAILVPGTARRTFWVSAAAGCVAPFVAYVITVRTTSDVQLAAKPWLPLVAGAYVAMWSTLTVTVATVAAKVIYGLSQRVREVATVGQYTLEEKIGEGGMGVVYRARHALLRRPTAVKLLRHDVAGPRNVHRFEREVQLTSGLTHPNTIAIYDFGHTPEGVFYYAMEYLDGITLEDLVAHSGALPVARVVHLLKQLCGALVEAHSVGLIHRDIKPANVMICVRGCVPDQIKVVDFGLVKEHAADESAAESRTSALVGTPLYLAPESITDPGRVDARVDLYAVGAVAYFLLVGAPVFKGRTLIEICAQHLHGTPVPPSLRTEQVIPPALEDLVLSCLQKVPAARPATAAEILATLNDLTLPQPWTSENALEWWREAAPELLARVKARRSKPSWGGMETLAVDLYGRTPKAASGVA